MGLLSFVPLIGKVIDKVFPDPKVAAEAKYKLLELQQKGELAYLDADVKLAVGQMEINKEEAKSTNWFVAGWRPAIGWICGTGLGYAVLVQPLLAWVSGMFGIGVPPQLDISILMPVLLGILGLGAMRTREKEKGVSGNH